MNKNDKNYVATTIRVPDDFLSEIKVLASTVGDSQNGQMLNLMYLGMKMYQSNIEVSLSDKP